MSQCRGGGSHGTRFAATEPGGSHEPSGSMELGGSCGARWQPWSWVAAVELGGSSQGGSREQ